MKGKSNINENISLVIIINNQLTIQDWERNAEMNVKNMSDMQLSELYGKKKKKDVIAKEAI